MHLLWNGLASYVLERGIELLFGVASFHGTDPAPLAEALSYLHHEHLAPPDLRVRAQAEHYLDMNLMPREAIDAAAGAAGDPAADQGLPAARRLRRRRRLRRPRLQHHRRLRGDGHRADDRALPALLPAHPGAPRVRAGWNEAEPPVLPPLTPARAAAARRCAAPGRWLALAVLFAVFLPLRGVDLVAARLAGRPVTALGPAVVRLWAAQALPTLGLALRAARRADARRRRVRRQPFELDRHRGAAARGGAVPRLQGRGARAGR